MSGTNTHIIWLTFSFSVYAFIKYNKRLANQVLVHQFTMHIAHSELAIQLWPGA